MKKRLIAGVFILYFYCLYTYVGYGVYRAV